MPDLRIDSSVYRESYSNYREVREPYILSDQINKTRSRKFLLRKIFFSEICPTYETKRLTAQATYIPDTQSTPMF